MPRLSVVAVVALVVLTTGLVAAAPARAGELDASIDYLYIEANEGGASGGHAAVRLGDRTYHFQYAASGYLEISRHDSAEFLREYALFRNRDIEASRIAVSRETFASVREGFNRRYRNLHDF